MIVDIIILSKTDNEKIYWMNLNCINSLLKSEDKSKISFNIILVESNENATYKYPETQVVFPSEQFGYNRFLNIGLQYAKGDFHAFCNNDLIFHENWMSNILNFSKKNPQTYSFSPIDFKYQYMKMVAEGLKPAWGYKPRYYIAGWCIVVKKEIFTKIECIFDPVFDFYYADDDYGLTLLKNNIAHNLVTDSLVEHLDSQTAAYESGDNNYLNTLEGQGISYPKYLKKDEFKFIRNSYKLLLDYLKMYNKWGGYYSLNFKYKIFKRFPGLRKKSITKLVYSLKLPI
jgi:glycosyltransferase involved in cell wall biosynthesis